jgi:hypothetical protein
LAKLRGRKARLIFTVIKTYYKSKTQGLQQKQNAVFNPQFISLTIHLAEKRIPVNGGGK